MVGTAPVRARRHDSPAGRSQWDEPSALPACTALSCTAQFDSINHNCVRCNSSDFEFVGVRAGRPGPTCRQLSDIREWWMELSSINNTVALPIDGVQFHCHAFNGSWLSGLRGSIACLLWAQSDGRRRKRHLCVVIRKTLVFFLPPSGRSSTGHLLR